MLNAESIVSTCLQYVNVMMRHHQDIYNAYREATDKIDSMRVVMNAYLHKYGEGDSKKVQAALEQDIVDAMGEGGDAESARVTACYALLIQDRIPAILGNSRDFAAEARRAEQIVRGSMAFLGSRKKSLQEGDRLINDMILDNALEETYNLVEHATEEGPSTEEGSGDGDAAEAPRAEGEGEEGVPVGAPEHEDSK